MNPVLETYLYYGIRIFWAVAALAYTGLVVVTYWMLGNRFRLNLDRREPGRSAIRLAVWVGVRFLTVTVRALGALFELLSDTSADVGEWFLSRQSARVRAAFRSRFL